MALTAVTHLEEETKKLKKMYDTQDMSEEDFENYLEDSLKLNQSIYINLDKAASLVRSFKQVAVDQTSNHDRKFNFEEYTQEILQSLHSQLKKLQIKIELAIDKDLEIHSNPGAFSQILSNFIMNSITHGLSSAHEGLIRIEAIRDEENFILKYSDNGKGMDKKTQEKIFDPFFTTNRENGGSGLGMNIIFNLVTQKLHGKIELETGVNQGVLFTIRAPLHYKSKDIKEVSPL
jgi:signal transduction histidine kinase